MQLLLLLRTAALYLLPVLVVHSWLSNITKARGHARVLDASVALGFDGFLILLCSRLVPLATSVWIVRTLWVLAWVGHLVWRRPAWRNVLQTAVDRLNFSRGYLALGALVLLVHLPLSWGYMIWDRDWHIPLSSALRTQTVPFDNALLPLKTLQDHYLGDVYAAVLQTLSGHRLHASAALSLSHDIFASLAVITLYGTFRASGSKLTSAALVVLALSVVFAGPYTLARSKNAITESVSLWLCGQSYFCLFTVGYRPHVMPAVFYLVAMLCAVIVRSTDEESQNEPKTPVGSHYLAASLVASTAALALLDEISLGFAGLGLGVVWIAGPRWFGSRWWHGAVVLAVMLLVFWGTQRLFVGALAPGGPVQKIKVVDHPRMPGVFQPTLLLSTREGKLALRGDALPIYAAAAIALYLAVRDRSRSALALAMFQLVVGGLGIYALVRLEVNETAEENQRFVTAGFVLGQAMLAWWVARPSRGFEARALALVTLGVISLSSLAWYRSFLVETMNGGRYNEREFGPGYTTDCKAKMGPLHAKWGATTFVDSSVLWIYSGCQPLLIAGIQDPRWPIAVHVAYDSQAMSVLRAAGAKGRNVERIVCPFDRTQARSMECVQAYEQLVCRRPTPVSPVVECAVDAASRARFF